MNSDGMDLTFKKLDSPDCVFIFDGKEIRAHKLMLTCCSPVFEKMFFGKMASNRIIITDIPLEDFTQMLCFIYTKTVQIESVLHAWSLFYVADKYQLDNFANVCVNYIKQNLTITNLILNYEFAEMYGIDQLQSICLSDIGDYIKGIFFKVCDYHMKATSLVKILEQKHLNITNNELIIGVVNWAVTECDIQNINLSLENVINLLKSLRILQFLVDLDFNITTNSDSFISKCCTLIKTYKSSNVPNRVYLKKHWCIFCKCRQMYKISSRIEMRDGDFLISNLSVNKNSLLFGLVVSTENEPVANYKSNYNGVIEIRICETNFDELNTTKFEANFLYETLTYVPLNDVVFMEANKIYSIKISYKNYDFSNEVGVRKSSVLCNYMCNKLLDQRKNVVFSFDELDGSVIRGISYYLA